MRNTLSRRSSPSAGTRSYQRIWLQDSVVTLQVQTDAFETHLYIEKARKSHLARVVLMDITVVVTYSKVKEHMQQLKYEEGGKLPR